MSAPAPPALAARAAAERPAPSPRERLVAFLYILIRDEVTPGADREASLAVGVEFWLGQDDVLVGPFKP